VVRWNWDERYPRSVKYMALRYYLAM